MSTEELVTRLRGEVEEGEWSWLAPHHARGAVIVVAQELDLAEVAAAVANDVLEKIRPWLEQKQVAKPDDEQAEAWNAAPSQKFRFLIIQPYVLVQLIGN